jgi:hypothetical protein
MSMRLSFILLACLLGRAAAVCYLEDANAACAVCWRTAYSGPEDKTGVTTMAECPEGIAVSWQTDVPQEMFAGSVYPVTYRLTVDEAKFPVYKKGKEERRNHVPHANIHSCIASRGACTPFVANSPGLATHTPAAVGDLTTGGVVDFTSDIKLTEEVYTIIAHVRFYTDNDKDVTLPHVKYDVAIGVSREVLPQVVEVSTDSYITTGAIGGILLVVLLAIGWAARSGKLDVDKLLETIYSEHVTCIVSMIGGLADAVAFSVSVFTVMQTDNALVQALPASYFFMCTSWLGSLYVAWTDLMQLNAMYLQHSSRERFVKHLAKTAGRRQVSKARRLSLEKTDIVNPLQINGVAVDPKCKTSMKTIKDEFESKINNMGAEDRMYDMLLELELSARELTRKQGDVLTILTESIPITAIQIYTLNTAKDSPIITIITLVVASLILGAKVSGLGGYKESRIRRDKAEEAFRKHFGIEVVDDKHNMVVSKDQLDKMASGELAFVHMGMGDSDKNLKDTARSSEASSRSDLPYIAPPKVNVPGMTMEFRPQYQTPHTNAHGQAVGGIGSSIQMGGLQRVPSAGIQRVPSAGMGLGPAMV